MLVRLCEIKRIGSRRLEPLQVVFHKLKSHKKNREIKFKSSPSTNLNKCGGLKRVRRRG